MVPMWVMRLPRATPDEAEQIGVGVKSAQATFPGSGNREGISQQSDFRFRLT